MQIEQFNHSIGWYPRTEFNEILKILYSIEKFDIIQRWIFFPLKVQFEFNTVSQYKQAIL